MFNFAAIGYSLSAGLFGFFALLLLPGWRTRFQGIHLFFAIIATALWAGLAAWHAYSADINVEIVWASEVLRNLFWMLFLLHLLQPLAEGSGMYSRVLGYVRLSSLVLGMLMLLVLAEIPFIGSVLPSIAVQREFSLIGQLLYAVLGMALIEQLFRNTPEEQRWGIKYMCFGLGVVFVYDFYLYTDALLFHRIDANIWSARGAVDAMAVPLIGVTAARNPDWALPVFISRRMVFHSTTLFGAGLYMLMMAMAGYYIKLYGGEWGDVLQITFIFGMLMLLAALLFSGHLRSRIKVFLNKHFFNYRYDYREEWLRLMGLLAGHQTDLALNERVIWALSEIVDSPGGLIWLADEKRRFNCVAHFNQGNQEYPAIDAGHGLLAFMQDKQWIVDLDEYRQRDHFYEGVDCPKWLFEDNEFWLLIPLLQDDKMLGFVALTQPRASQLLNWESRDLLKTAGMQAASYLALYQAADALADARQFEGFNRLSAFVMHDLKNLIAQLSLVAKNAAKHKRNPEFIDDAVQTIENSVNKMNRLMIQLKTADATGLNNKHAIDLVKDLRMLVDNHIGSKPMPIFETEMNQVLVLAEEDRLSAVLGHILQNALDATSAEGRVVVMLRTSGDHAIVEVQDSGTGMDADFIKNSLFRPFYSTKGLTGMGIGAYECREVVQALGGQVDVDSEVGQGTVFRIMLPLATY